MLILFFISSADGKESDLYPGFSIPLAIPTSATHSVYRFSGTKKSYPYLFIFCNYVDIFLNWL